MEDIPMVESVHQYNLMMGQETFQPKGRALLFHPDSIRGTSLGQHRTIIGCGTDYWAELDCSTC